MPRQKRKSPRVKGRGERIEGPSADQVEEAASESRESAREDSTVNYGPAASADDTLSSETNDAYRGSGRARRQRAYPDASSSSDMEAQPEESSPVDKPVEELQVEEEITLILPQSVILALKEQARREKIHHKEVALRALKEAQFTKLDAARWSRPRPRPRLLALALLLLSR